MTSLRFSQVTKKYGKKTAVNKLDLTILSGEIVSLIGPSGCGKTTCLRMVAGVEKPDSGEIFFGEKIMSGRGEYVLPEKRGVGFLFQEFALFPHLSVIENVLFGLKNRRGRDARKRAEELLEQAGVLPLAKDYPGTLSGGEQQRVALARALAPSPKLILMDEPFSNLDPLRRDSMRKLTLDLLREENATCLMVTHDADDAMRMADRIAVMNEGKLVQFDKPGEIYRHPADPLTARLLGRVNEWSGPVMGGQVETPFGTFDAPGDAEEVRILVRPHDFIGPGSGENISVLVRQARLLGGDWQVEIAFDDGTIWEVRWPTRQPPQPGVREKLRIRPDAVTVFGL